MGRASLPHRGIIRVAGDDARNFLQGIVTNDMQAVSADQAIYACFLTPQGKYLADFFVYADGGDLLFDVDRGLLPDLLRRLTLYKLRSRVTLTDASTEFTIAAAWGEEAGTGRVFADPRCAAAGVRILNGATGGTDDYAAWQMQNGLPDAADFARERTTMLEANMDFLHAISWTKGCYMGQELTARTHYRGLTKKRFLPLALDAARNITGEIAVIQDGVTIGHAQRSIGRHALASIQLAALQNGPHCTIDGVAARIVIPEWFDLAAVTTQP